MPEQTYAVSARKSSWQKWVFIILLAAIAFTAYNWFFTRRVITVVGVGTEKATASKATISFAYTTSALTKDQAISTGEAEFTLLLNTLNSYNPSDLKRVAYQVQSGYNTTTAANEFVYISGASVTVSGQQSINALLTTLASNNVQNTSIRYLPEDEEAANAKVQELALADARKKAENIAKASGGFVGKVLAVSEQSSNAQTGTSVTNIQSAVADISNSLTEVDIQSVVTVTFELW